jgi:transforming growth factor-beta-induced protein
LISVHPGLISGQFTAPTNDAFDALIASQPEGTLDLLAEPENILILQSLLKYHVLGVEAPSSSLASGEYETLNGESVTVTVSDSGVMVNDANVIMADIMASNGVIHVIDKVLEAPSLSSPTTSSSVAASTESVSTTAAVESVSTTAATESSPTTTAAEASSATESASTTAAVAEEETVTAEGETAAPSIAVAEVTVSPTATPAAKSG